MAPELQRKRKPRIDTCPFCGRMIYKCVCDWDEEYEALEISPCCKAQLGSFSIGNSIILKSWWCSACGDEVKRVRWEKLSDEV